MSQTSSEVSLFIPCLVEHILPEIGLSMAKVLDYLGCQVTYNPEQTCCGQPAYNGGHHKEALEVAECFLDIFEKSESVVVPSGSCTAMVRNFYPKLFAGHPRYQRAAEMGSKIKEFSEFIVHSGKIKSLSGRYTGRVGFHNSCHSFRELNIIDEPLTIMKQISGYDLIELKSETVCCGFGGLFSVKFPAIASAMAQTRLETFQNLNIDTLVSNDPGCIMHLKQEAKVGKMKFEILHLTEFLAKALAL